MKAAASKQTSKKSRVRKVARHRSFKLTKEKLRQAQLPGAIKLWKAAFQIIRQNKRLFLGIAFINALFSFVFVQNLGSVFDLDEVKTSLEEILGDEGGQGATAVALFGYLIGSAGSSAGEGEGIYQIILLLLTTLAIIWGLRQVQAGEKPLIRDTFYKGMYPLVPFLLVLFVIGLQLLPLIIGNVIYSTVIQTGIAVTVAEALLWFVLFLLLALLSAYMVMSSIFALYIVTLPDMAPLRALKSARELVLHRRFAIGLRLLVLPIVLSFIVAVIFMPLVLFATPFAEPLFLLMSSICLVLWHTYIYTLYRALI